MKRHVSNPMRAGSPFLRRAACIVVCLMAALAMLADVAYAQQYKTLPVQTDAGGRRGAVLEIWRDPAKFENPQAKQEFDGFFQNFLFPAMTQNSAEGLRNLGTYRKFLLNNLLGTPTAEPLYKHLNDMTLQAMTAIATDNFDPRAQFNAMVIIGSLDQKPGDLRTGSTDPPVPLAEALDVMLQVLQPGPNQVPDVILFGALIGLERHARYPLPEEKQKAVADALVQVVESPRPAHRTRPIHAWAQWRAVETLAQLGTLGENNRIHNAIVAFMNDANAPLNERMYAAKSLEKLKSQYTPEAGIDAAATVAALGNVLADLIEDEEKEAYKFNEEQRSGGLGGYDLFFDGEPPGYAKGRLLQRINYVLDGFAAIEAALSDEQKQQVETVLGPVRRIRTMALNQRGVDIELTRAIEDSADVIRDSARDLGRIAAPARATDAVDADEIDLAELGGESTE